MKKSTVAAFAALSIVGTALTGCGSEGAGASGLTDISVGVLPSLESAPLFVGVDEGFFADEGLSLRIGSLASGSAALIQPTVEGNYDVAVSDMLSLMRASVSGSELELIAPAGSSSGDAEADFGALIVSGDSDVQSLNDLEGGFVGSNSLLDTNDTVLRATMDAVGGISWTVQWREVAFQDAEKALDDGTVDAAFLVEPYLTRALNNGKRVLSYSYYDFDPNLDVGAYFTSADFAAENPDVLERFTKALTKSIEFSNENPTKVRAIVTTYTQTQWNERITAALPTYRTDFNAEAATKLATIAVKYLSLKHIPEFETFLP
ncbi:NitT/TauT family transport system substrate-binding protein [Homoserinimonas aerilata]|uniref:NitT/TauT family transport system substrate-binding protein n=1 Tax=Homoserinimonas aerilata TaxID=1162970 RepID=A0A542YFX7_9MICO|nr:ABC transporter substrate-binding protein [Homoserinimonas aerilata]TQL46985.1 NitT/TauT family transport system substrate-binding protein [Homoserinimonas aerilata]